MKNKFIQYVNEFQNGNEAGIFFLENNYNEELTSNQTEHILDYIYSTQKKFENISNKTILEKAEAYFKKKRDLAPKINKEKEGAVEIIKEWGNGFKIVKLVSEEAFKREGQLMVHCVGDYYGRDCEVFSLRDERNFPHCTIEKGVQIKGKGNNAIIPKYIEYIVEFLEESGMEMRDQEFLNLGYKNAFLLKEIGVIKEDANLFRDKYYFNLKDILKEDIEIVFVKNVNELKEVYNK